MHYGSFNSTKILEESDPIAHHDLNRCHGQLVTAQILVKR